MATGHFASTCASVASLNLVLPKEVVSPDSTAVAHALEDATLIVQINGCVEFGNLALVHNAYAVVVDDRLETMCNAEQCLACKALYNGLLNLLVCLEIDAGCRFVTDNDLRATNKCASQGKQLTLSQGEVESLFLYDRVEVDASTLVTHLCVI